MRPALRKPLFRKLVLATPVFIVVMFALLLSQAAVYTDMPKVSIMPFPREEGAASIVANTVFFLVTAAVSILVFYHTVRRNLMHVTEKVFVFCGGLLLLFFIGHLGFMFTSVLPFLLVFLLVYLGVLFVTLSIVFVVVIEMFSDQVKGTLFLTYGSVIGSFIGLGMPAYSMIPIAISLAVLDILLIHFVKSLPEGKLQTELACVRISYGSVDYEIGLGDLIYYSMFTSYSLSTFGVATAIATAGTTVIGWSISFLVATKRRLFPGLPFPILLGLLPILVQITSIQLASW